MRVAAVPRTMAQYLLEVRRAITDPVLAVWTLYILLQPIYVFSNGLPQPGDLLGIVLVPMILSRGHLRFVRDAMKTLEALILFLAYVVASALVWTMLAGELSLSLSKSFLMTPVFYLYNALFFVIGLVLYTRYRDRFLWLTVQLSLISVVLQTLISFVYSRGGSRGAVLFNSSNQLGYFALLSASILVLGQRRLKLGTLAVTIGLVASAYLALFSASKAALGGIAILTIVGLVSNPRMVVVACVAVVTLIMIDTPITAALDKTRHRLANDESAGFIEERGYDRIKNHKEYWLLGSGEGVYSRFADTTVIGKHEIHSSGGTLFFCYGIAGTLLFLLFGFRIVEGARLRQILLLLPVAGFSATHQSLRATILWVFLALFIGFKPRAVERGPRNLVRPPVPRPSPPLTPATHENP